MAALGALARPLLHALPPETAHHLAIAALRLANPLAPAQNPTRSSRPTFSASIFPIRSVSPRDFDKNAEAAGGALACGFSFVEVGTLTPRPQAGNPKPRLFRLRADAALINRMGFNNAGYEAASERLKTSRRNGVIGVNFGPNRDLADRVADFTLGVKMFAPLASYLAINISSPNTAGLRDLQQREALDDLVAHVIEARDATPERPPVVIKIAPDLDLRALDDICAVAIRRGADGLIISNTTVQRPQGLRSPAAKEAGGLSGRPLFSLSTQTLARAYLRCEGAVRLIGSGGVEDAETALAKIEAGADLVQVYTGYIYRGPALIVDILFGLREAVTRSGAAGLSALVGLRAHEFATKLGA